MQPLVVYPSRWRFALLAILLVPFALFGLLLLADDELESRVMGAGFVAFFGGLAGFALVQIIRRKPAIILSDAGIEDSRLKIGIIPWGEVTRAYELPYLWQKNVQVLVRNPEQYKRQQPRLLRALGEMNSAYGWQPFVLVTANTDASAKQVVDYIYQQLLRQWPVPTAAPVAAGPASRMGGEGEY